MRTSELYTRYMDKITAIAREPDASADWRTGVERVVRQFHAETMPMSRGPFLRMRDEMRAQLAAKVADCPEGPAHDVFALAARLIGES